MNRGRGTSPWPLWLRLIVVVLAGAALAAPFLLWGEQLARVFANREQVAREIRGAGAWGPLVVIGLAVAQTIVAPVPGQVVNFVAGYLYGPWAGIAYSWIGLVLGTAFAMALARFAGRPAVERLVSPALLARVDRAAADKGLGFFFLVFLIPGLPDDVLAFAVGLTTLPLRLLLPIAALARIPGLAGSVLLGANAEHIPPMGWAAIAVLAALALLLAWRYGAAVQDALLRRIGRS